MNTDFKTKCNTIDGVTSLRHAMCQPTSCILCFKDFMFAVPKLGLSLQTWIRPVAVKFSLSKSCVSYECPHKSEGMEFYPLNNRGLF